MTELPQIIASAPTVQEATEKITFDKYWVTSIKISAPSPNAPVRMVVSFAPARDVPVLDGEGNPMVDGDGNPVMKKELQKDGKAKEMQIADVLKQAESNPSLATVITSVLSEIAKIAAEQGVL